MLAVTHIRLGLFLGIGCCIIAALMFWNASQIRAAYRLSRICFGTALIAIAAAFIEATTANIFWLYVVLLVLGLFIALMGVYLNERAAPSRTN